MGSLQEQAIAELARSLRAELIGPPYRCKAHCLDDLDEALRQALRDAGLRLVHRK